MKTEHYLRFNRYACPLSLVFVLSAMAFPRADAPWWSWWLLVAFVPVNLLGAILAWSYELPEDRR